MAELLACPGPAPCRYYLNGDDAYRLKLLLPLALEREEELRVQQEQQMAAEMQGQPAEVM